jgi:4'-phosphopantetheinyl transferase EntD
VIEEVLLAGVCAAEAFEDVPDVVLFAEEEAAIARAVATRRREFATARQCARDALARLGLPPAPIVPGLRGAPGWPQGVVGSITHCQGYRAAAVALARDVITLGVDAEPDQPLPDGVLEVIALPQEAQWLPRLAAAVPGPSWDRLLFSAKESVYKAWFPLARKWLDFKEAEITIDPAGTFTARLLVPGPQAGGRQLEAFTGRWLARNGLLLTAIVVPAGS